MKLKYCCSIQIKIIIYDSITCLNIKVICKTNRSFKFFFTLRILLIIPKVILPQQKEVYLN